MLIVLSFRKKMEIDQWLLRGILEKEEKSEVVIFLCLLPVVGWYLRYLGWYYLLMSFLTKEEGGRGGWGLLQEFRRNNTTQHDLIILYYIIILYKIL